MSKDHDNQKKKRYLNNDTLTSKLYHDRTHTVRLAEYLSTKNITLLTGKMLFKLTGFIYQTNPPAGGAPPTPPGGVTAGQTPEGGVTFFGLFPDIAE